MTPGLRPPRRNVSPGVEGQHDTGEAGVEVLHGHEPAALAGVVDVHAPAAEAAAHAVVDDVVVELPEEDGRRGHLGQRRGLHLHALGRQPVAAGGLERRCWPGSRRGRRRRRCAVPPAARGGRGGRAPWRARRHRTPRPPSGARWGSGTARALLGRARLRAACARCRRRAWPAWRSRQQPVDGALRGEVDRAAHRRRGVGRGRRPAVAGPGVAGLRGARRARAAPGRPAAGPAGRTAAPSPGVAEEAADLLPGLRRPARRTSPCRAASRTVAPARTDGQVDGRAHRRPSRRLSAGDVEHRHERVVGASSTRSTVATSAPVVTTAPISAARE